MTGEPEGDAHRSYAQDWIYSGVFSPDGKTLASASLDVTVRLRDAVTSAHKVRLTGHTKGISDVVFSPEGNTLTSGSLDDTMRLWDAMTGEPNVTLTGHTQGSAKRIVGVGTARRLPA